MADPAPRLRRDTLLAADATLTLSVTLLYTLEVADWTDGLDGAPLTLAALEELLRAGHRPTKPLADVARIELPEPEACDARWHLGDTDGPVFESAHEAALRGRSGGGS